MQILVAIPCLNEEQSIKNVIERVPKSIEGINKITILVVDDGSTDDTANIAKKMGAIVIQHYTNLGVGCAFNTAVSYALDGGYDVMVNIDGDGQFQPEDISLLVKPIIDKNADFVTASRFINKESIENMSKVKLYGNYAMSFLVSTLCKQKFWDVSCGFRAYSRETLLNLNLHGDFTYTQETFIDLASKRIRIMEIPIEVKYFKDRKSRVAGSIWNYTKKTSSIILRVYRDYYPFQFFGKLSVISALIGLVLGIIFLIHFLATGKFTGYLFAGFTAAFFIVMSIILLLTAVTMDMMVRIRKNQERILYNLKKRR